MNSVVPAELVDNLLLNGEATQRKKKRKEKKQESKRAREGQNNFDHI